MSDRLDREWIVLSIGRKIYFLSTMLWDNAHELVAFGMAGRDFFLSLHRYLPGSAHEARGRLRHGDGEASGGVCVGG